MRLFSSEDGAYGGNPTAYWTCIEHLFGRDEYVCSACGCVARRAYRDCPECGADMRKVRRDPRWADEAEGMSALFEDDCL